MERIRTKIIIPRDILDKIKEKIKPQGNRTQYEIKPTDLLESLYLFINDEGKNGLQSLNKNLYDIYKDYIGLSSKTLGHAFAVEGNKDDGAMVNLCELLCYFRFKKSWPEVLKDFRYDQDELVQRTKDLKEKKEDELKAEIVNQQLKKQGKKLNAVNQAGVNEFAKRIYIELSTRKAGIVIDEEKDVIEEIYNSWYQIFCNIRQELKSLPVESIKNPGPVVEIPLKIMEQVLRPHLTEHQAKFRSWLEKAKQNPQYSNITPQQLQKQYPEYESLFQSLKAANKELIKCCNRIYTILKSQEN